MIADCMLNTSMQVERRRATTSSSMVRNRKTKNEVRTLPVAISTRPISLPLDQRRKDHRQCTNCGSDSQEVRDEIHPQFGDSTLNYREQHNQQRNFGKVQKQRHAHASDRYALPHTPMTQHPL